MTAFHLIIFFLCKKRSTAPGILNCHNDSLWAARRALCGPAGLLFHSCERAFSGGTVCVCGPSEWLYHRSQMAAVEMRMGLMKG